MGFQGLPVGTTGKLICLLDSSNCHQSINSCRRMIGRGMEVSIFVPTNQTVIPDIKEAINKISSYQPHMKTNIVEVELSEFKFKQLKELSSFFIFEPPCWVGNMLQFYKFVKNIENTTKTIIVSNSRFYDYDSESNECKSIEIEKDNFLNKMIDEFNGNMLPISPCSLSKEVLMLLSGGIDSPVSSHIFSRSGYNVSFIHFATDINKINNILDIRKKLGSREPLYVVQFKEIQEEAIKVSPEPYRTIIYKILMVIIANKIAEKLGIEFIGTGNSLGQVASQTCKNLLTTRLFSKRPILSPLLGYNKDEIIKIAKNIGTFEPSTCDGTNDCCVMYLPKHPVLKADPVTVGKILSKLDMKLIDEIEYEIK